MNYLNSVFDEINKICHGESAELAPVDFNRYMVRKKTSDRMKTLFCFGVPVFSELTKGLVELTFRHNRAGSYCFGSNAEVRITDVASLKNGYGSCRVSLPGKIGKKTENAVFMDMPGGWAEARPTLNGLLFKGPCAASSSFSVQMTLDRPFQDTRANDKYFAVMREEFVPFVTVSCIGILNNRERVVAPCEIGFQKVDRKTYVLTFRNRYRTGNLAYEINLHEAKLFQDTTVESKNPKTNNAFGGIAFLGKTSVFGEQWLYSRLDFANLSLLQNKKIVQAILHIPELMGNRCTLTANRIADRFCSFGSDWKNKIPVTGLLTESVVSNGYHHLDITGLIGKMEKKTENFVLRAKIPDEKKIVIPTGDSYFQPQILEIKYQ